MLKVELTACQRWYMATKSRKSGNEAVAGAILKAFAIWLQD